MGCSSSPDKRALSLQGACISIQSASTSDGLTNFVFVRRLQGVSNEIKHSVDNLFKIHTRFKAGFLLHRHRLRQIPRLVHVRAFEHGDVVGQ